MHAVETISSETIEILAPETTGPWRKYERFSPMDWGVHLLSRETSSWLNSSGALNSLHGTIQNISIDGIAFQLDNFGRTPIRLGERYKLKLDTRITSHTPMPHYAFAEVVRPHHGRTYYARFINVPEQLLNIIKTIIR